MVVFPLRLTDGFLGKRTFKSTVHPSSRFIRMGLPLFFNYYLFFLKIRNTRRKQVRSGRIVVRFFSSHTKKGAYGPKRVFGANVLQKKAEIKRLHFLKTTSGVRPPAVVLDRTSMRRVSAKFRGVAVGRLKTICNGYRQTARGTHAEYAHPLHRTQCLRVNTTIAITP